MALTVTLAGVTRRSVVRAGGGAGLAGAAMGCGGTESVGPARPLPAQVTFVIQSNAADNTRYWQRFVSWFGQEHPSTKVEAIVPTGEYETKVLTMLAGGSAPDLFHLNNRFIYDFFGRGLLQPLDQLLRRQSAFPMADIIPGVLIPYRVGNQLVGIPRDNSTSGVYYNKELFAASGLKEPATNWTWDDYLELARKLTSPDRQRYGSTFPLIENLAPATHLSYLRSFGGDWFDANMREVLIDKAGAQRAFQFALDLRFRHGVVSRETTGTAPQFASQTAAMVYEQQGFVQRIKRDAPGLKWDMAPLPRGSAGRTTVVGTTGYCIPKGAAQPDGGAALLTFLLGERVQKDMMSEGRWTTPRKSLVNHSIPGDGAPSRFKEAIVEPMLAAKGVAMPSGFPDMEAAFVKEMQPVWIGERSLQQGLTLVKQQWTQLLEAANRARK